RLALEATGERNIERRGREALGRRQSERRARGELACPGERIVEDLLDGNDPIDETPGEGLARADAAAGQHQLLRTSEADEPRQALRAAEVRDDAPADLVHGELRVLASNAQVARDGELDPAAERRTAYGSDRRDTHGLV